MDIKILDSWLRDYLETKAKPAEIAKYLSLCGPSIERIEKLGEDSLYDIEVTTNRIDTASIYGIAREAASILPRFGIKANLKHIKSEDKNYVFKRKVNYLEANIDEKLCPRFTAVLIKNIEIAESPKVIKDRLESAGVRPINNVIDISNYLMLELGQPMHTFDYDKMEGSKMILRESKKGEEIQTLDDKVFKLPGGDIVIEDGSGRLIDLAGIMGGKLSAVTTDTKNVLLFVQTYDSFKIRKTSMALAQRTMAATMFEKGLDAELVGIATLSAIDMFKKLTNGTPVTEILNIYAKPYKTLSTKLSMDFIKQRLGVEISKSDITKYLSSLEFDCTWSGNLLTVKIPSFRAGDVKNEEDVLEEIARIYGYHNLPSKIMETEIPDRPRNTRFEFETKLRSIMSGFGGTEVYTLSLVPKKYVDEKALKLRNALGLDTEYLRTSLMPSLIVAAKGNVGLFDKFHIFEIANVYIPKSNDLPNEKGTLAGVFSGYSYREAKGIVEGFIKRLNFVATFKSEESKGFGANKCAYIHVGKTFVGKIGYAENEKLIYYEFNLDDLISVVPLVTRFKEISKFPSQVEDLTVFLPDHTRIGDVIGSILNVNSHIKEVTYVGEFNSNHTFHIKYHNPAKTLTDQEVEKVRGEIISSVKSKFGAQVKN